MTKPQPKRRRKPIALKVGKITADIDNRDDNSKRGDFLVGPRIVTNSTLNPDSASSGPQVWLSEECKLVAVQMPIEGTNYAAHVAIDSNGQLWVDARKIRWDRLNMTRLELVGVLGSVPPWVVLPDLHWPSFLIVSSCLMSNSTILKIHSPALGPYNDRRNPRRFLALIDGPVDASRFSTGVAAGIELIDGALKVTIHLFDTRQGWTKINELDLEEMVVLHKLGDK